MGRKMEKLEDGCVGGKGWRVNRKVGGWVYGWVNEKVEGRMSG